MTTPHADNLHVHLAVDDALTAQAAGARFACTLAGAEPHDFAQALAEQVGLIEHTVVEAGYTAEQARLAAGHFEAAAAAEWQRIAAAGGSEAWGTA